MAVATDEVRIGDRPLHVAVGAGHHNATPGDAFETALNGQVCHAVVNLFRASLGFEVRCYTPGDGLGLHAGPVDAGPRAVATLWDPTWTVDIFHEIHAQAWPAYPRGRGAFLIYPDGAGLLSDCPNSGEVDERVREHGLAMARLLAAATGLPVGGPSGRGVMSERETLVGGRGCRLRVFAATATPAMIRRSCRFITEVGAYTNALDKEILCLPEFPTWQAVGIVRAHASLARAHLGWTATYWIEGERRP